jgi:hypothetical protein
MGETAQRLARRYPGQAETMIRRLGVEGMTAVRVYGDDVAEVVAKEGPESINVLRKAGRGGWTFFTETVLPHKKKLAAAGVLALFLANPDRFVDSAGRITEYAVDQFARAGIRLAGAVGGGATPRAWRRRWAGPWRPTASTRSWPAASAWARRSWPSSWRRWSCWACRSAGSCGRCPGPCASSGGAGPPGISPESP